MFSLLNDKNKSKNIFIYINIFIIYIPVGHGVQVASDVAPVIEEYVPI